MVESYKEVSERTMSKEGFLKCIIVIFVKTTFQKDKNGILQADLKNKRYNIFKKWDDGSQNGFRDIISQTILSFSA